MSSLSGLFDSIASALATGTGTGLDVLSNPSQAPAVAEYLFSHDLVPATAGDVLGAFVTAHHRKPTASEVMELEMFLISFGWLD